MSFIYLEVYRLIYPICMMLLKLLAPYNLKIKKGLRMRETVNRVPPWLNFSDLESPILIHCASGEFEYAKSVIREIKKRNPNQAIAVTYFSPTYEGQIKNFEGIDFSCPLPWDLPHIQREFLTKLRPKQILIARTDLWPELLVQAKALKIPIILFSAVLSSYSSKVQNFLLRSYHKWLYSYIFHIYCATEEDRRVFAQLTSPHRITAIGDTRYDQILYRLSKPNYLKDYLVGKKEERTVPTFIAGSTWEEDEREIVPVLKDIIRAGIKVMIAPHEPTTEHVIRLKAKISKTGIRPILYSEANEWLPNQVLIIDQLGILADLYAFADWAFVGGSFKKQVHSVMEPLAQGCKTFFGPYHQNSREAIMFQRINNYAVAINSGLEMAHLIIQNRNMDTSEIFKENLKTAVYARAGASEKLVQALIKPTPLF